MTDLNNKYIEVNKIMNMLCRKKFPEKIDLFNQYTDQYWVGRSLDNYYYCVLCAKKLAYVPYDNYLDNRLSYQHAITHIKEHKLLILL